MVDRKIPQYMKMCLNVVVFPRYLFKEQVVSLSECWVLSLGCVGETSVHEMADVGRQGRISWLLISKCWSLSITVFSLLSPISPKPLVECKAFDGHEWLNMF